MHALYVIPLVITKTGTMAHFPIQRKNIQSFCGNHGKGCGINAKPYKKYLLNQKALLYSGWGCRWGNTTE